MSGIKTFVSLFISIVLILTFVGCGEPVAQSEPDSQKECSNVSSKVSSNTSSKLTAYQIKQKTKVNIMPLGDSLTQGGQHKTSAYRGYLSTMLKDGGHNSVFVGCHNWSYDSIRDGNWMHSGFGGATVKSLSNELESMKNCNPDIILLMIGRNDNTQRISAEQTVKDMDELLINKLYEMFPDVHIFLANPPPVRGYNGAETLNNSDIVIRNFLPAYRQYVEDKKAQGYKIDFVEMTAETTGIVWEDYTADDFVHPLPQGYEKLANHWYNSIKDTVVTIQTQKENQLFKQ